MEMCYIVDDMEHGDGWVTVGALLFYTYSFFVFLVTQFPLIKKLS
jgi:hypothetical protein